jgi:hypothetical protein
MERARRRGCTGTTTGRIGDAETVPDSIRKGRAPTPAVAELMTDERVIRSSTTGESTIGRA